MNRKNNIFCFLVVILGILLGTKNNVTSSSSAIETYPMSACYAMDVYNPKEVVGEADYVFAAKVESMDGTIYKNKMWSTHQDGTRKYTGDAYTKYTVQVISNLKNELVTERKIPLLKMGGIREDGSACDLMEDDFLPEAGKTYIFMVNTQDDGSLLVAGANSNIEVKGNKKELMDKEKIKKTEEFKKYKNAVKNQKKIDNDVLSKKYGK